MGNKPSYSSFRLKILISVSFFLIPFITMFLSELFVSFYSIRFEGTVLQRIIKAFDPSIVVIYLVLSSIFVLVSLRSLRHLFYCLDNRCPDDRARNSAAGLPWIILYINLFFAVGGAIGFYAAVHWNPAGGVPLVFTILMKTSMALVTSLALYVASDIILYPARVRLGITKIRSGESDSFSRAKMSLLTLALVLTPLAYGAYFIYWAVWHATDKTAAGALSMAAILPFLVIAGILFALDAAFRHLEKTQYDGINGRLESLNKSGGSDLSVRIPLARFDDFGSMASSINTFCANLSRKFSVFSAVAVDVERLAAQVSESAKSASLSADRQAGITGSAISSIEAFRDSVDRLLLVLKSQVETQADVMREMESLTASISGTAEIVQKLAEDFRVSIRTAGEGIVKVNDAVARTSRMNSSIQELAASVRKMSESMGRVHEVLTAIDTVAESTDILSMNAAIEAAHAGEYGRGFAIVAAEVRTLAESSRNWVTEISGIIAGIQSAAGEAARSAETAEKEGREGHVHGQQAGQQLTEVLESVRKAGAKLEELFGRFDENRKQSDSVRGKAEKLLSDSRTGLENLSATTENSRKILSVMESLSENAETSRLSSGQTLEVADSLTRASGILETQLSDFRLGEEKADN